MERKPLTKLTNLRVERGLSLGALGRAVGVHTSQLSRIEAGTYGITPALAAAIEKHFGPENITRLELLYPDEYQVKSKKPVRSARAQEASATRAEN